MATIFEVNKRVQQLDLRKKVPEIIAQTKDAIADAQAVQMFSGTRSDDTDITPDYSDVTIEIKKEKGQPTDRVTLRDEGPFQNEIDVDVEKDRFRVFSRNEKMDKLVEKYGEKIFGLNTQHLQDYGRDAFRPELVKYVEETTGLKMK